MEVDKAQPLAHGHPGTPVRDMFPLGTSVFRNGSRGSLCPSRAGECRCHSAGINTGEKPWPTNRTSETGQVNLDHLTGHFRGSFRGSP